MDEQAQYRLRLAVSLALAGPFHSQYRFARSAESAYLRIRRRELTQELGEALGDELPHELGDELPHEFPHELGEALGEALGVGYPQALREALGDELPEALGEALGDALTHALGDALGEALGEAHPPERAEFWDVPQIQRVAARNGLILMLLRSSITHDKRGLFHP